MAKNSGNPDKLSPLKRALMEIRELRARVTAHDRERTEPIAVIGLGIRFPGQANDPETYWALLRDGVDAIDEVPADRWDINAFYDPDPDAIGKISSRWGGFIERIDEFDADFFGISPREVEAMDPQQRLLLEVSWEALEHAAQSTDRLQTTPTGVFVGIGTSDYAQLQAQFADLDRFDTYFATGSVSHSVASGRLAYVFGLQGPTLSVDTACSSSLMSVHLACQSLRLGECGMALAGGVNVILAPENSISLSKAHMMAADGRCKTFDARADGFVRAEGCGMIVLKRLSDARRDNDNVLCVIRGSATNQDGRSQGLTAPNGPSQEAVVRLALNNADVDPGDVSLIETHGTGTALGDPIEIHALDGVFKDSHAKDNPLLIGSVKTNVGHLETAAGIASLIKVVLALMHKEIPPSLHFRTPNPHISWDRSCTEVVTKLTPWEADETRIAGVSSFGFSGTNVHILMEEAPEPEARQSGFERPLHLMTVSARDDDALRDRLTQYATDLRADPSRDLADFSYTTNAGRTHFECRAAVICDSNDRLAEDLTTMARGEPVMGAYRLSSPDSRQSRIVFMFTGQGAQYADMGRALYETQPTFRNALNRCNELLEEHLEASILNIMYQDDPEKRLHQTVFTQPALFALGYALACLWRSWGVEPAAVIGHSVGEYVAACVAGVFSLEDGLKLIAARARLMQDLPSGGVMLAALTSKDKLEPIVSPHLDTAGFAAFNAPEIVVVSGKNSSIDEIHDQCSQQDIETKYLEVSHAFHSPLMEPMIAHFSDALEQVSFNAPRLPLISNIDGQAVGASDIDADYWCRHIRQPVNFAAGINTLWESGHRIYLELGPTATLCGLGQQNLIDQDALWLPSLRAGVDDWQQILESLGQLYVQGNDIDWRGFDRDYARRYATLPNYPFQRSSYWVALRGESGLRINTVVPVVRDSAAPIAAAEPQSNFLQQLKTALPDERRELLLDCVRKHVARVLKRDPSKPLDQKRGLMDLGLDSLMAVELRSSIGAGLGLERPLPATLIHDHPTIEAVVRYLLDDVLAYQAEEANVSADVPEHRAEPTLVAETDIEEMSEQDAEDLLLERLKAFSGEQ